MAAERTTAAATNGIHALSVGSALGECARLGHSMALAAHSAAESLTYYERDAPSAAWDRERRADYAFPRPWQGVVDRLGVRILDEMRLRRDAAESLGGNLAAAAAADDGALHAVRFCSQDFPRLGAVAALHRMARITSLASAFVGWSLVDAEP